MKKVKSFIAVASIVAGIIIFKAGMTVGAAAASRPGTTGDPLITQSYLEQRLSEVVQSSYNKVLLTKGKTLSLDIGSEVILYNGSAYASGTKGLINLTDGGVCKSGNSISAYSLYFSPDKTSGITSQADCILYVKGGYKIK